MTKFTSRMSHATLALVCVLSSFVSAQPPQGQIYIVDASNGPGANFTTISAAVAVAVPHDRILVRSGVYVENVVVNVGITIVGSNATTYPLTYPALSPAVIQGTLLVDNVQNDQTLVISGLDVVPNGTPGYSVGLVNSRGPMVLDRMIIDNGSLFIQNGEDVLLQDVRVRAPQGGPGAPLNGVQVYNSWVQATDLDVKGGDVGPEPAFSPTGGAALEVIYPSIVALARPKLEGGSGAGPWNLSASTPAGGPAIRVYGGIVAMVDDPTGLNFVKGGQGGERGAASSPTIAAGNGGDAVELFNGAVVNKKPIPLAGGNGGLNQAGGPVGTAGSPVVQFGPGLYISLNDPPALFRIVGSTAPGGMFTVTFESAAAGLLCGLGACDDFDLALLFNSPSVQFSAGKPSSVQFLALGTSNAQSIVQAPFMVPNPLGTEAGRSGMFQGGDIVGNVAYLSNPSVIVLGF